MPAILCPTSVQLAAFNIGKLNLDDFDQIAAHLETCSACQTVLDINGTTMDSLLQELRAAPAECPYTTESGCDRAVAKVRALAGPGAATMDQTNDSADSPGVVPRALGKYAILGLIGAGGMGTVYKATHTLLKKTVALKVLPPGRMKNAQAVARFRREIEAAGRLDHPHIVRTTDAGEADGQHFLVMEWLDGEDLHKLIRRAGALPIETACDYIRQAALGLDYAHRHNMVHRDVKPSNLLLANGGDDPAGDSQPIVKVLDLGLALLHDATTKEGDSDGELTSTGQVMGTYDFIAPEQAMETHTVDGRADIYSLGCTFYYLLTGHTPFQGKTETKKLLAHQLEQPTPLSQYRSDIPAEVLAVVARMMEKDPANRYASMREVAEALTKTAESRIDAPPSAPSSPLPTGGEGPPSSSPLPLYSGGERPGVRGSKRPKLIAASLLLGLLAVIAIVVGIIRIATPEGDYHIDTDDPDFLFSVSKGSVFLEDKKTSRKYKLKAVEHKKGEFELEVTDVDAELSFKTKSFTIKRGETVALRARFERKRAEVAKGTPGKEPMPEPEMAAGLAFNGANNWVTIPSLDVKETTIPLTVEAWVVLNRSADRERVEALISGFGAAFLFQAGKWRYQVGNQQIAAFQKKELAHGKPIHLAGVFDGDSVIRFFVDGELQSETSVNKIAKVFVHSSAPSFGRNSVSGHFFHGRINEIRFSKTARYDKDFTPRKRFEPDADTIALYHFDEGKGNLLTDYSGNGHHGNIVGAKWVRADGSTILPPGATPVDAAWIKLVAAMPAKKQVEAVAAKLKELNPGFDGKLKSHKIEGNSVIQFALLTDNVDDITPVAALPSLQSFSCAGSNVGKGLVTDLSPLKGMQLTMLDIDHTFVEDLSPLKKMKLSRLNCFNTLRIVDLSPLKDMPLTSLSLTKTRISDLSQLKGMKLKHLWFNETKVADLSALQGMPLESIYCDFRSERDAEILRSITTLKTINGQPAAAFWKEVDKK